MICKRGLLAMVYRLINFMGDISLLLENNFMSLPSFEYLLVGNPNRKKMHIFGFVGIFEYIC